MLDKFLNIDRLIEYIYFLFMQNPTLASETEKNLHKDFLHGYDFSKFHNLYAH